MLRRRREERRPDSESVPARRADLPRGARRQRRVENPRCVAPSAIPPAFPFPRRVRAATRASGRVCRASPLISSHSETTRRSLYPRGVFQQAVHGLSALKVTWRTERDSGTDSSCRTGFQPDPSHSLPGWPGRTKQCARAARMPGSVAGIPIVITGSLSNAEA